MLTSQWRDGRWGRIARGSLGLVIHGTGSVLIVTGHAVEFCGNCLQDIAARLTGATRSRRTTDATHVTT